VTVSRWTTACTTADSPNPRINAQAICQDIENVSPRACPTASSTIVTAGLSVVVGLHPRSGGRAARDLN
jgi:hypothetical protein